MPPISSGSPGHDHEAYVKGWRAAHFGNPGELGRIVVFERFYEYDKGVQSAILAHELAHSYRYAVVLPRRARLRYFKSQTCHVAEEAIADQVAIMLTGEIAHMNKRDWTLPQGRRLKFYVQHHAVRTAEGIRQAGWSVEELWSRLTSLA